MKLGYLAEIKCGLDNWKFKAMIENSNDLMRIMFPKLYSAGARALERRPVYKNALSIRPLLDIEWPKK